MTPGAIAILSTCGLLAVSMIGTWVELRRQRVAQMTMTTSQREVAHEMKPNHGGSLRDAVNQVGGQLNVLDSKVDGLVERLVRVETLNEVHLNLRGQRE